MLRTATGNSCNRCTIDLAGMASGARWLLAVLLAIAVGLLIFRRWAGAFDAPLPAGGYLVVAAGLIISGMLVRGLPLPRHRTELAIGASALSIAGAFAVTLPQATAFALLCLWVPLAVVEGWAWRNHWGAGPENRLPADAAPAEQFEEMSGGSDQGATEFSVEESAELIESNVVQSIERRTASDGSETISGYARARFEPGERTVYLHVPFCPPLASVPEFAAEGVDGATARVRAVQVLPHGARLEVKLEDASDEAQQVLVEFSAY